MSKLIAQNIVSALDIAAEVRHRVKPPRNYLGASVIGHACDAYCVMDMLGWPTKKKPSTIRAGELGHIIEDIVIDSLREIGLNVLSRDPDTHGQYEFTSHDGRFQVHLDGFVFIDGDSHVLEIKSAKHSRFLPIKNKGLKAGDRLYYDQVTAAMGMSEVHEAAFIVLDKDTGEFYSEIVEFDPFHWAYIQMKIDRILAMKDIERIAGTREYQRCKMCDRADWCWGKTPPVGEWMPNPKTETKR